MFACLLHRRVIMSLNAVDVGGSSGLVNFSFWPCFLALESLRGAEYTIFLFYSSLLFSSFASWCCKSLQNSAALVFLCFFLHSVSLQLMRCFFLPIFVSLLLSCCRSSAPALPFGLSGSNYPAVLSQNSCRREEGCGLCVRLQAGVAFFACRFTFSLSVSIPSLFFPVALGNSPDVKLLGG